MRPHPCALSTTSHSTPFSTLLRPSRVFSVILLLALLGGPSAHAQVPEAARPLDLSPQEVQAKTRLVQAPAGFTLDLFAAPPEVNYPTAITATPEGHLFVAVDRNGSLDRERGRGEILKVLDTDGDGQGDHYTSFVDSVDSPRGLAYDGQTLYVMHPPTLTAYTDTDGDGVADTSTDLVEGLGFGLDFRGADHTTNGLQMGIDGWLYIAVGDYGFLNATGTDGRQISNRGGGVVRVRPDGTELEVYATGLRNPYDVALDPLLNGFLRGNTNDGYRWRTRLQHVVPRAEFGYPSQFHFFADEVKPPLADYGGGSGTGALYVDAPALPDSLGHTLYTVDWGRSAVFRHALAPDGASFDPAQEVFLRMPQPTDMTVDGRSNLYLSSWMGASFTYTGEDVGFIVRLRHEDAASAPVPDFRTAGPDRLVEALSSEHSLLRLYAQRALLRRAPDETVTRAVARLARREEAPRDVRVAALFTLKQLEGPESHRLLAELADDPALRAYALRALADRTPQTDSVPTAPFVEALAADDPTVRLHALNGLARLDAQDAADDMVPLLADPDRTVAHVAAQSLVDLGAVEPALAAVRDGSPALVRGGLTVLVRLHRARTITGLQDILERTPDPFTRRQVLAGLARLYHREDPEWTIEEDWWGTTPSPRGPYHDPVEWAESARIRPLLRDALLESEAYEYRRRVQLIERNRALPDGAGPVLLATASDSLRARAVGALLGHAAVTGEMVPTLDSLAGHSRALQRATTDLLTAQRTLPAASLPLLRDAVREDGLQPTVRAEALRALTRHSGDEQRSTVTALYARMLERAPHPAPLTDALQAYLGRSRHAEHASHFVEMTRGDSAAERKLGYAVLVHLSGNDELDAATRRTVRQALEAGWEAPARASALLRAIGYTQVEGYADQVRSHLTDDTPEDVRSAARYAARRLGL